MGIWASADHLARIPAGGNEAKKLATCTTNASLIRLRWYGGRFAGLLEMRCGSGAPRIVSHSSPLFYLAPSCSTDPALGHLYSVCLESNINMNGLRVCLRSVVVCVVTLGLSFAARAGAQSSGPGAAYACSEGTGTTTADGSGNGNTGTLVNGPTWTTGAFGTGLTFDGTSGAVQVPMSATLALTTAFTVEAWVRPTDVSTYRSILNRREGALGWFLSPDGKAQLDVLLDTTWFTVVSAAAVPLNRWTHLAVTYDGTALCMYVDGTQVASVAASGALAPMSSWMEIGSPGAVFAGALDEVRIYARALSATEGSVHEAPPTPRHRSCPS